MSAGHSPSSVRHQGASGRWELVQRIFHAAVDLTDASRGGFVHAACDGDLQLEEEVSALLAADRSAGSYMEVPLLVSSGLARFAEASLQPGEVLCERFEIRRSIAEGGMGQVFEALDRELNVHVALKVIRPEIAEEPEALARFRQEVRLARTITHLNVCRTFDINRETRTSAGGCTNQVLFLTMELLRGETLAARIKRDGALKLDEAEALAKQMAGALDAAHALGVIHRDMKPANVMLVPLSDGGVRAVVTDFGLARVDPVLRKSSGAASLSDTAQPLGTLAYMAPEQIDGGAVSPATDVYGFGLILFEMVTGSRAFPSENPLNGLTQRLTGAPPSARALAPNLPATWCYAIERCLRLKAAERFQRAGEVVPVLNGQRVRPGMLRQWFLSQVRTRHARRMAFTAGMILVVSLSIGGLRLYQREGSSYADARVAAGALVYLAPVKNQTGEPRLDNVTELLQAGLAQSAQMNLLDQERVGDILERMTKPPDTKITPDIAREVAMCANAVRVIFATLTGGSGRYQLEMEVQQPDNKPTLFRKTRSETFSWSSAANHAKDGTIPPELLSQVREASDWVRQQVGESSTDIARLDIPPEDVTTNSWEALDDYTRAEALRSQGKNEEAVTALRSAITQDPAFVLADARLGDILVSEDDASGYSYYLKALDQQDGRSLSLRERDRLQGIYASDTRNFQTAEESFREYSSLYPADYLGWFYRAYPLMMLGRGRDAIRVLERAHTVRPQTNGATLELAQDDLVLGDFDGANHWMNELRLAGYHYHAAYVHAVIAYAGGDANAARRQLEDLALPHEGEYAPDALRWLIDLEVESGNPARALELTSVGLKADAGNYQLHLDRADLLGRSGDASGCVLEVREALKLAQGIMVFVHASRILGRAIAFHPEVGRTTLRHELSELEAQFPLATLGTLSQLGRSSLHGELLLAEGDVRGALSEFRHVDALDAPATSRDYMARALMAASAKATSSEARALQMQARAVLAHVALHDGVFWQWQDYSPPGFYRDQVEGWVKVSRAIDPSDAQLRSVEQRLSRLHP